MASTEKKRFTQYRKRNLRLLERRNEVLEKSRQQILNAEMEYDNEMEN